MKEQLENSNTNVTNYFPCHKLFRYVTNIFPKEKQKYNFYAFNLSLVSS